MVRDAASIDWTFWNDAEAVAGSGTSTSCYSFRGRAALDTALGKALYGGDCLGTAEREACKKRRHREGAE